jgi:hypothetical protein
MDSKYSQSLSSDIIKIFLVKNNIGKYGIKVKQILNNNIFSNKDFDSFIDLITNQHTIDDFKNYFRYLKVLLRLNNYDKSKIKINNTLIRSILCAYTILYYPEIMNIDDSNSVSRSVIEKSKSLTLNLKILQMVKIEKKFSNASLKSINIFFNKCEDFIKIFNHWKDLDMEAVICNLAKVYMELEREFKEIEETVNLEDDSSKELLRITKENLEGEKDKIIEKVKKLSSQNGIEIFNKYYLFINQELDSNIYKEKMAQSINDNIKKAYWDIIENDMLKVPPDYGKVIILLEEAKILLKQCIPKRPDLISEIDMNMEIETLRHYLENNLDVSNFISTMIEFIITKIMEFQARTEEESFNKFLVDFNKLRNTEDVMLSEMLIFFFQGIMPRLDLIVQSKHDFEEWYSKNINK